MDSSLCVHGNKSNVELALHLKSRLSSKGIRYARRAQECFHHAAMLTLCDSQVYNRNLGLALLKPDDDSLEMGVISVYEKALEILKRSQEAGCISPI